MRRQLRILGMLFRMKLSRNMAFRFSFFGVLFVDGSLFLIQLLMFSSIYAHVGSIGGWKKGEMLIFIGTFSLINALNMALFFFGVITIPGKIKSGELDLYITKPVKTLMYLSFESMDLGSVPLIFASIGILLYGAGSLDHPASAFAVMGYVLLTLLMLILWYDMMVLIRTIPFFTVQASSVERMEGEVISLCLKIPGTFFTGGFKVLFYLLLPYGIMATVPAQFLAGTLTMEGGLYGVGVVVAFSAMTRALWRLGLKHYKSASS